MTTQEKLDKAIGALEWIADGFDEGGCECSGDNANDWEARIVAGTTKWEDHYSYCGDYVRGYVAAKLEELRTEK